MYHSDYESDFDGRIPVRWRPSSAGRGGYHSDTSDAQNPRPDQNYRRVQLPSSHWKTASARSRQRAASAMAGAISSPPCPHQWESHEEIARLEASLNTGKTSKKIISLPENASAGSLEERDTSYNCFFISPILSFMISPNKGGSKFTGYPGRVLQNGGYDFAY